MARITVISMDGAEQYKNNYGEEQQNYSWRPPNVLRYKYKSLAFNRDEIKRLKNGHDCLIAQYAIMVPKES